MKGYLLRPHSPLVFRSGRPFDSTGGGDSLAFPLPSTLAGALRAAHADQVRWDFAAPQTHRDLRALPVAGPLLAQVDRASVEALFPKPADAVYLAHGGKFSLARTKPQSRSTPDLEGCDLPPDLRPVFLEADDRSKPAPGPAYWTLDRMAEWLAGENIQPSPLSVLGSPGPSRDVRSHVAIDESTFAAADGVLFQTTGLDFEAYRPRDLDPLAEGWESPSLALLAAFDGNAAGNARRLGGDGRTVRIEDCAMWPKDVPDDPLAQRLKRIRPGDVFRLVLATPGLFDLGFKPGWTATTGCPPGTPGLRLKLVAAAVERWQPFSGWDLETLPATATATRNTQQGQPRAVRRLAPAGSVYWFELVEGTGEQVADLWLKPISDRVQDRLDGFGLALPGVA